MFIYTVTILYHPYFDGLYQTIYGDLGGGLWLLYQH